MELRRYGQIIWRYWPVVLILTLVGVLAAAQYYQSNRPAYQASTVVNIYQEASPNDPYSGLYAAQNSEYAGDDFIKVIGGNQFMTAVSAQLKEINVSLSPDELKSMVAVERKHRELTITSTSNDPNNALQVARAVANVLERDAKSYVKGRPITATVLDVPSAASLNGSRNLLLTAVRVLAGLLAGVGLAFLLAYLDTTIRSRREAEETMGLPVLGVLPRSDRTASQLTPPPPAGPVEQAAPPEPVSIRK